MFDIFCHKITFVFQDTQVDVSDLIDLGKAATHSVTKQQLVDRITAILDKRKNQRDRDELIKKHLDREKK